MTGIRQVQDKPPGDTGPREWGPGSTTAVGLHVLAHPHQVSLSARSVQP